MPISNSKLKQIVEEEEGAQAAPVEAQSGPDKDFIIEALMEELQQANNNRIFLVATVKQLQAEFAQAQKVWGAERESILKGRNEKE